MMISSLTTRRTMLIVLLSLIAGGSIYYWGVTQLWKQRPEQRLEQMRIRLPVYVQVLMAMGDRYLASNINVMRATVVGASNLDKATYQVLGNVQLDAAFLNPGNEDNYYLASAILPWEGEVTAAQRVLALATEGRPTDPYPPFYYGFNQQYFLDDYIGAAKAVERAAARVEGGARLSLLNIASKWYERVDDPQLAERTIATLRDSTRDEQLRAHLQRRIERVRILATLQQTVQRYREHYGKAPATLDDLRSAGLLERVPEDPLGEGFVMKDGRAAVNRPDSGKTRKVLQ